MHAATPAYYLFLCRGYDMTASVASVAFVQLSLALLAEDRTLRESCPLCVETTSNFLDPLSSEHTWQMACWGGRS